MSIEIRQKHVLEVIDMYVRINNGTTGVNIEITNLKKCIYFFTDVMQMIH